MLIEVHTEGEVAPAGPLHEPPRGVAVVDGDDEACLHDRPELAHEAACVHIHVQNDARGLRGERRRVLFCILAQVLGEVRERRGRDVRLFEPERVEQGVTLRRSEREKLRHHRSEQRLIEVKSANIAGQSVGLPE